MSRTKKSRKPGVGSSGAVKDDKKKVVVAAPRKPKNKKGKVAGNRQQEAKPKVQTKQTTNVNKDPRIGSKKPIVLVKETNKETKTAAPKTKTKSTPIAAIRPVESNDALEQELYAIEADPRLQAILEKQEDEIALSEDEVSLFNELMDRHETLRTKLGWTDDEEEEQIVEKNTSSEDDLWDKFDSGDLSDYQ